MNGSGEGVMPRPEACPVGHALEWIAPGVAVCACSASHIWRYEPRAARGLRVETNAVARGLAETLRAGSKPDAALTTGAIEMVAQNNERRLNYDVTPDGVLAGTREEVVPVPERELPRPMPRLAELLDTMKADRIPLGSLRNVDVKTYQRDKKKRRVAKIRKDAFWVAFGAPLVSLRKDGSYWVIDGQHRVAALLLELGPEYALLCVIVENLTPEEEARGFDIGNSEQQKANSMERWKSGKAWHNPEVDGVDEVVKSLGLEVAPHSGPQYLTIPGSLRPIFREPGGRAHLHRVLKLLKGAWYGKPGCFSAAAVNGMDAFLGRYATYRIDEARLVRLLALTTPDGVMDVGRGVKRETNLSMNVATQVARAIVVTYNKRGEKLPAWDEVGAKETPRG